MIVGNIDLALISLYIFWVFFAVLIYYLQTENMREGYPMEDEDGNLAPNQGPFPLPSPKTFQLPHGRGEKTVPNYLSEGRTLALERTSDANGFPHRPTGDPMRDGVGAGAWAPRRDVPELDGKGHPKIRPLRDLHEFSVSAGRDPRGLPVEAGDGTIVGEVVDMWIDEPEAIVRYLEVELASEHGSGTRLLPLYFSRVGRDRVRVRSIFGHHFAHVPRHRSAEQVTLLEEERISAYYGGGLRYATPTRLGR